MCPSWNRVHHTYNLTKFLYFSQNEIKLSPNWNKVQHSYFARALNKALHWTSSFFFVFSALVLFIFCFLFQTWGFYLVPFRQRLSPRMFNLMQITENNLSLLPQCRRRSQFPFRPFVALRISIVFRLSSYLFWRLLLADAQRRRSSRYFAGQGLIRNVLQRESSFWNTAETSPRLLQTGTLAVFDVLLVLFVLLF